VKDIKRGKGGKKYVNSGPKKHKKVIDV